MANSFSRKRLGFKFILKQGDFGGSGNTLEFEGLASYAKIEKPGLPDLNNATINIIGLSLDNMKELTDLSFKSLESQKNLVFVYAGDESDKTLSLAFAGEITNAFADFLDTGDAVLKCEAVTGSYPQQIAESPISTKGEAQVSDLISIFSANAGYSFVNHGVTSSVKNSVYNGDPLSKAMDAASHVDAQLILDDDTLVLMNRGEARPGVAPLISLDTGLDRYPSFTKEGIIFNCLYNPDIVYGGLVEVESVVPQASGFWKVTKLTHTLNAYNHHGGDFTTRVEGIPYA